MSHLLDKAKSLTEQTRSAVDMFEHPLNVRLEIVLAILTGEINLASASEVLGCTRTPYTIIYKTLREALAQNIIKIEQINS